ncbi:endonuclease/exonuclease/phosphatase family protein [Jatrophihabitans sp. YIM 134969]
MTLDLRVMSYNVRSLRDDPAAIGRVMRDARPDVVIVQEAPRFARWRSHAASIARRAGLVVVTGGRTAAGNLLLCDLKVEVERAEDVLLSPQRRPDGGRLHQRGLALAALRIGGTRFVVGGTHLDLDEAARLRHADEIRGIVQRFAPGLPSIVGGDTNDRPGSALFAALGDGATDVWAAVGEGDGHTFRATAPDRRIDAVFVSPGIIPVTARVVDSPDVLVGSDHRPLVVDLTVA